jgi:hypothetical protein
MLRKVLILLCCLFLACAALSQDTKEAVRPSPAEGYNIHVVAPHLVDGKQMGPYHHYCKVVAPDPQIVCLIFESTEPNAMLMQVEYIWAKSLTRSAVPLKQWNKYWHDHAVEIAGGRVKVLDMPDDKAKEVADIVSKTDGYIIHIPFTAVGKPQKRPVNKSAIPDDGVAIGPQIPDAGKVSFAQAVGHKPLTAAEYKKSAEEAGKK